MSKKLLRALICIIVTIIIWFVPVPTGLKLPVWHLFAIFVGTILGFILQPAPMGTVAFIAIVVSCFASILNIGQALSGFSNSTTWLIVSAFMFARGFIKTGLGRRIAFLIMRHFGNSSLKLSYSITAANLILGPVIPSNTARNAGVFFPIVQSLCEVFDSHPTQGARKIGSFLMSAVFQTDLVVSAMFLTSMAANPLMAELAEKTVGVTISWGGWALAALVPGILALIIDPIVVYKLTPPEIKHTPEAEEMANNELAKMGAMSKAEKAMTCIFIITLICWILGTSIKVFNGTTVALFGISLMLVTGVLEWNDIISEKGGWNTMVWTGTIICFANFLNSMGFIPWFSKLAAGALKGMPWLVAVLAAGIIYIYSHYFFASMSAHVSAMYAAFAAIAVSVGAPPFLAVFIIAVAANLCGGLTHFSTGPAPVFFGAGYVPQGEWWRNGFIVSVVNIVIWFGLGPLWWKVLGLW